ncbi:hypothetical protein llap_17573 [Limosa lapponica baueri]|uniref:Uncharacterized protein n=1 Tax=Limosa lapponica baueri TaxID=1758121 RepID=A0A2I0TEA1_LIMLA|nr:hypothetical protein llap_17573 [Limosa lapponica baueri]
MESLVALHVNNLGLKAAFHRKVATSKKLSISKDAFRANNTLMPEADFLPKFISVQSLIYLHSNAQNKQKQKVAENEIQADLRNKSVPDSAVAKPFVPVFISEKKKTANTTDFGNGQFAVHVLQAN